MYNSAVKIIEAHTSSNQHYPNKSKTKKPVGVKFNNFIAVATKTSQGKIEHNKNHTDRYNNASSSSIEAQPPPNLNYSAASAHYKDKTSSFQSQIDQNEDELTAYVNQFKMEIERKFYNSKINTNYSFPKETTVNTDSNDSSLDSLKNVNAYDLSSQNKRYHIPMGFQHKETKQLQQKHCGSQDQSVIDAMQQLENAGNLQIPAEKLDDKNSILYKALYKLIEKNLNNNFGEKKFEKPEKKMVYEEAKNCHDDSDTFVNANNSKVYSEKFNTESSNMVSNKGIPVMSKNLVNTNMASDNHISIDPKEKFLELSTNIQKQAIQFDKNKYFKQAIDVKNSSENFRDLKDKMLKSVSGARDLKKTSDIDFKQPIISNNYAPFNNYKKIKVKLETTQQPKRKVLGMQNQPAIANPTKSLGTSKNIISHNNSNRGSSNITNSIINSNSPKSNASVLKSSVSEYSKDSSHISMNSNNSSNSTLKITNLLGMASKGQSNTSSDSENPPEKKNSKHAEPQSFQKSYSKLDSKLLAKLTAGKEKMLKTSDNSISAVGSQGKIAPKGNLYQKTQNSILNARIQENVGNSKEGASKYRYSSQAKDGSNQRKQNPVIVKDTTRHLNDISINLKDSLIYTKDSSVYLKNNCMHSKNKSGILKDQCGAPKDCAKHIKNNSTLLKNELTYEKNILNNGKDVMVGMKNVRGTYKEYGVQTKEITHQQKSGINKLPVAQSLISPKFMQSKKKEIIHNKPPIEFSPKPKQIQNSLNHISQNELSSSIQKSQKLTSKDLGEKKGQTAMSTNSTSRNSKELVGNDLKTSLFFMSKLNQINKFQFQKI